MSVEGEGGRLDRISGRIDRTLLAVSGVFLTLMMLHITADVLMRYLFNVPIGPTLEVVSYYYMVLAIFFPLSYVERRHENIQVDLFTRLMPAGVQFALYLFACVIGLAFFGVMAYQTFLDAISATANYQTVMSNVVFYIWPSIWALPISFAATCLAIINSLVLALARRRVP